MLEIIFWVDGLYLSLSTPILSKNAPPLGVGQSAEYGMCTPEIFLCKTCCTPVFLGVATKMGVAWCGPIENVS